MSSREEWKRNAAKEAAELVEDDMSVGLGSGTTLAEVVKILGEKETEANFVVSSISTQKLVEKMNLNLISLEKETELDMTIDGADEVNPNFHMVKGGGGAHTREKIGANAAEEVNIVVDKTKLVKNLGEKNPIPAEIIPFAKDYLVGVLENFGQDAEIREASNGEFFCTDNGNYIIDTKISNITNPEKLENDLNQIPGIIENGIFTNVADKVFVGMEDGSEQLTSEEDFQKLFKNL